MSSPGNTTGGAGVQCTSSTGWNGSWDSVQSDLGCINTYKVDSQIFATMITSSIAGALCLGAFCVLQTFISVYRGRLLSPQVAIKPPVYTGTGIAKYFHWAWVTISMKEKELLATAGMDALMFERLIVFALQLMAPYTIASCAALIPIHATSDYLAQSGQQVGLSNLMVLTMSNMEPKSKVLWVHFSMVWLYCLYALWLLDRHYKWYVLLRQQYMTRGDSISTWLGRSPNQPFQGLRSKSVLLASESPTKQLLLNPNAGFARCRPSDDADDESSELHESPATALTAPGEPAVQRSSISLAGTHAVMKQQQQLHDAQHGTACSASSPFAAAGLEHILPAAAAAGAAHSTAAPAGAATVDASPADSRFTSRQSSGRALLPPDSVDRSSSQHLQEVSVEMTTVLEGDRGKSGAYKHGSQVGGAWGFITRGFSGHRKCNGPAGSTAIAAEQAAKHRRGAVSQPDMSSAAHSTLMKDPHLAEFVSAAGEVVFANVRTPRSSAGAPSFLLKRWNSLGWQRLGRTTSVNDEASAEHQTEVRAQLQQEWQQQQLRQRQQREAEAARAAAVAQKLGADVDWWAYKTGDPLLDRHVVQVDVASDMAWDTKQPEPARLQCWWELAPSESGSSSSPGSAAGGAVATTDPAVVAAPSELHVGHRSTRGTVEDVPGISNIAPVPGTQLLFDRRSLLARKPSVRFRNTVHVQGAGGAILPLHVSNYAVLVTDVPGDDGPPEDGDEEDATNDTPNPVGFLPWLLNAAIWSWPCLLRQADLTDLGWASSWNSQSFRSAHNSSKSMLFSESMRQLIHQHQRQEQQHLGDMSPVQQEIASRRLAAASSGSKQQCITDRQRLVEQTFKQLFPDDLHAVIPVRNFQAVDELLQQWNTDLQAYIQGRALLQLRLERAARRAAAPARDTELLQLDDVGAAAGGDIEAPRAHSLAAATAGATGVSSGATAAKRSDGSGSGIIASAGLRINTQVMPSAGGNDNEIYSDPFTPQTGGLQQLPNVAVPHPSLNPSIKPYLSVSCVGVLGSVDEPCRTPRLAPLKPRPVLSEDIKSGPRHVSKEEEEGTTAMGRCCASIVRRLCRKAGGEEDEEGPQNTVDAVAARLEVQRQALVDLEASILAAQKEVLAGPDTGSFIVLFKTPAAATLASRSSVFPQSVSSQEAFKVQPAPGPEDVLWQTLWKAPAVRRDESLRCLVWYAVLYLVPTGIFTAALNSISYAVCNSPELGPKMTWFCDTRLLQFLFTVVLPMVLLMLWQNAVIPANLYKLELRRGASVSLSGMERNILLTYFGWELVNLFLGGVLSASLVSQVKMLADNPDQWALLLGAAFPNSSNFFLNYVIARAFMMNLFRLIMPHGAMWRWIGQMLFTGFASFKHAATERYRAFIIYPASIRYGREPGLILLILLMGVAYSIAAPLMTPFVLAYMCTAYLVWRYQMIYVCVRCYESGGKMWPVYHTIVLWIMGLFVVFTSCILIFKDANLQGVLMLPLLPIIYIFARYCNITYSIRVEHPPLWLAHEAPRTEIDPLVYTPTCLQPHAQGWYFEMGKAWVRWGVPAYTHPTI